EGVSGGAPWTCGLEFDYANDESFYCRPLRLSADGKDRQAIPEAASGVSIAFLPPMSGLASVEPKVEEGRINVLMGEGQTAQVLRNLCHSVFSQDKQAWQKLCGEVMELFRVELLEPRFIEERGEIVMAYRENGIMLDLSCAGRGLQQTLLLLGHLYRNTGSVLLLDEPDAHLEVLRQGQTYNLLSDVASVRGCRLVVATHSEAIMNEAGDKDVVVAFLGSPHRVDDRSGRGRVGKSLKEVGFDQYLLAQERGWVLYVEGSTDLAILRAFARLLDHPARALLDAPFVKYMGNQPSKVREHFCSLVEAKSDLEAFALFDNDVPLTQAPRGLKEWRWPRREIESYLCRKDVLVEYARGSATGEEFFPRAQQKMRVEAMHQCIAELENALKVQRKPSPWSGDIKVTDEFLDPLFAAFFEKLGIPNVMRKTDYHSLVPHIRPDAIHTDVRECLNLIAEVAGRAVPPPAESAIENGAASQDDDSE
ncbi:MAG: AAA family ATPase, partial [Planctomycetes bacterium]|nr:AAA family ATPase [Planctomycetota bacterium]